MNNYILRQNDGFILVESEEISDLIEQLVEYKLREIDKYNVSIEEKLEYQRYPYMNDLYNLYTNADKYNQNNFDEVENIYNDENHIPYEEFIKLEVIQYV
ncbi:hypothetical protein BUZ67_09520 [Staphylococcus pasteuri]|uniref:hypothetical protein n=1 Tax=Staphylococcus pasteuri TaxID=45972 RepID=UPI000D3C030C|nr:hypothetical protein [Staphylococcus pasteuri]PTU84012.1 hypothetical protein BUZ67_09520 [Staphylococcus pasteuri]